MANIFNIPIERIHPHPQNPRKDMGDISELIESVKINGIMQNLTVVQKEGEGFTVVIGHRRLAAAAAAGLRTVPCSIVELDETAQIRTMLMENVQRKDLTIYEQAQGFQMMLDLGDTVEEIVQQSGFSKKTVRQRLKLLDLDPDKFKASEGRGATLEDYMELDKVKDIDRKNTVLDAIGTADFRNKLRAAVEEEKRERTIAEYEEAVKKFAQKIERQGVVDGEEQPMRYHHSYGVYGAAEMVEVPEDAGEVKYYYVVNEYTLAVYREINETELALEDEKNEENNRRREEEENIQRQLCEITDRHRELRLDFIKQYGGARKKFDVIAKYAAGSVLGDGRFGYRVAYADVISDIIGVSVDDENTTYSDFREMVMEEAEARPAFVLLATVYSSMDDPGPKNTYWEYHRDEGAGKWVYSHKSNEKLDELYKFLSELGYEESEEEVQMRTGTHPLFYENTVREQEASEG